MYSMSFNNFQILSSITNKVRRIYFCLGFHDSLVLFLMTTFAEKRAAHRYFIGNGISRTSLKAWLKKNRWKKNIDRFFPENLS